MNSRLCLPFTLLAAAILTLGCGSDQPPETKTVDQDGVNPHLYFGTYAGRRIDVENSATPASIEELIPSATLTLHDQASTFTMFHEGLLFGGEYIYDTVEIEGETVNTIEFVATYIEALTPEEFDALSFKDDAPIIKPDNIELEQNFAVIISPSAWRFIVLEDGFEQIANKYYLAQYRFTRDDSKVPLGVSKAAPHSHSGTNEPETD